MRKKYSSQIYRADGRSQFVEILNSAFPIDKAQINAIEYDKATNKTTTKLPIYVDVNKLMVFARDVESGQFQAKVQAAIADGKWNGVPINSYTSYFVDMGGIDEEGVKKRWDSLHDLYPFLQEGMAISRQLKVQKASKPGIDWIFRVEYGPGRSDSKGLIVPNGMAPVAVSVPMTDETLKEMMTAFDLHYSAYVNHKYSRFGPTLFPNDGVEMFTPDKA